MPNASTLHRLYELHLGEKDSLNEYLLYQHKTNEQEVNYCNF